MSLERARHQLSAALDMRTFPATLERDWPGLRAMIVDWWNAYKDWEKQDSFAVALKQCRMSVRYVKAKTYSSVVDMGARKLGEDNLTPFRAFPMQLGLKAVVDNSDPTNFLPPKKGAIGMRAQLGLYDAAASLIDPRKPMGGQFYNKVVSTGDIYVFSALSDPDDQVVFQHLNERAKAYRKHTELYDLVRDIRTKLTRVKLACEHDMGSNFTAFAPDDPINPKFKYGLSVFTKLPDPEKVGELKKVRNTEEVIAARRLTAMNFKAAIQKQYRYNEFIVAYRQHAGPFPVITKAVVQKPSGRVDFQVQMVANGVVTATDQMIVG